MKMQITAFGETKSMKEWHRDPRMTCGIKYTTFVYRLKNGICLETALTQTPKNTNLRYTHNDTYFSSWTHENAWTIGFITADGCVEKNKNNIKFHMSQKDISILEHIRHCIAPQKAIKKYTRLNKSGTRSDLCKLDLTSSQMVNDLSLYNISPQKTGKEKLPDFPNKEIAYRYLLGLLDGDGSVVFNKIEGYEYYYHCSISLVSGSKEFLESIQRYFNLPLTKITVCYNKMTVPTHYVLHVGDKQSLVSLYHNLYDSGGFCLQRKKDKFTQIIEYIKNKSKQ